MKLHRSLLHILLVLCALALCAAPAWAADAGTVTLKDIKEAGIQPLPQDQVKALVLKGTVEGESKKYKDTIRFYDDGTLKVESSNKTAWGKWSVAPDGTFEMSQDWPSGKEWTEGKVYPKDGSHFVFRPGAADDAKWVYYIR